MRLRDFILPGMALGAACVGLSSTELRGFDATGESLDLGQRDFRVFNNFTDPTANDNQTPDPSFPGALGAPLAIWKGVVEWGSELHGSGYGDPHQIGDLGSGGANFDSSYQGLATSAGGSNDNIISQIDSFGGAVRAFTELPITDGWRIRFHRDPTEWDDGPGAPAGLVDPFDIQGVMAHEYGHALGLDHSTATGATMNPSTAGANGVHLRSLGPDDSAGVQFIYGVRSPLKPHIDSYEFTPTGIAVLGTNFAPTNNTLWFTRGTPGGEGTPVQVSGLDSTLGGTRIETTVPVDAGPGDILVKLPGMAPMDLSGAYPFDPNEPPCSAPQRVGTPKQTSIGTTPSLEHLALPSAANSPLVLHTQGGVGQEMGILFSGPGTQSRPFFGGTLSVAPPFVREQWFQFFAGSILLDIDITPSMVGTTRVYQLWFQDPGDPFGLGLSDALVVTFCP